MVINSFENRTFMRANVKAQHAVWGASFCFFWVWEWGRVGFFIFSFFLMCSQAPNFFLKTLASHFSSHIVQPSLNQHLYIDCKGVRGVWDDRGQREAWQSMFLFWGGKYIQVSMLWSSPCVKHIGDGAIKWLLQGQKNCGCTFPLMNRNKNKYPETYLIFPRICVWISKE
jgi:hypothetical protein